MNAVEREPVETRVLNPTASEANYKPKQRNHRNKNLKKYLAPDSPGAEMSGAEISSAEMAAPNRPRRICGAETYPTPIHGSNIVSLPILAMFLSTLIRIIRMLYFA